MSGQFGQKGCSGNTWSSELAKSMPQLCFSLCGVSTLFRNWVDTQISKYWDACFHWYNCYLLYCTVLSLSFTLSLLSLFLSFPLTLLAHTPPVPNYLQVLSKHGWGLQTTGGYMVSLTLYHVACQQESSSQGVHICIHSHTTRHVGPE